MSLRTHFECPICHEPFTYEPSGLTQQSLREMELTTGRPVIVWIECPHCPAYLEIDHRAGLIRRLSEEVVHDERVIGGVAWDMTLTEKAKEKVADLNKEGDQLMRQGNVSAAKVKFEEALQMRKHDPLSWYNLGVCLHQMRDLQGAITAFQHATDYDEKFVNAWNNLGMILAELGHWEEAERCFDKGIEADPDYPKCYLGKGNVFLMRGDFARARQYFHLALKKDRDYAPAEEALRRLDLVERSEGLLSTFQRLINSVRKRS